MSSDVLVTGGGGDFRDMATRAIEVLIVERDGLDQPVDIDLDAAKEELETILDEFPEAIAELSVNAAFDLIEMQRGAVYDVVMYNQALHQLDNAALVAEAEAVADAAAEKLGRIQRRKALTQRLAYASQTVARGVLVTAIARMFESAGLAPTEPTA